jgi:hypothetical protein
MVSFQLQDFRCPQTKQVSRRLSSSVSSTHSVPLVMDITPESINSQLMVLRRVADYHHFELLRGSIDDVLVQ